MDVFSLSISFGYFDGHMSLILKQLPNIVLFLVHYLSQNMTYHWNFNMYNMMGATSRAGTAHLPQHLSLPSVFSGNCAAQFLVFNIVFGLFFCPFSLGFCIICPSKLRLLIAPFDKFKACMLNNHKIWSSQIFGVMEIYLELYENAIYKRVQISVKTFRLELTFKGFWTCHFEVATQNSIDWLIDLMVL